jgi:excisionase family DNA binding protein
MSDCSGTDKCPTDGATEKRLLTVKEFSVQYRRSRSRTYELIRSGELQAVKDGRSTLIPVDAAEAWAQNLAPFEVRAPLSGHGQSGRPPLSGHGQSA